MIKPKVESIRAVALDMDGTLLTDQKKITPATKRCIAALGERGIPVILVTGRSYEALEPFKRELELTTPVICYNGAQIVDGRGGQPLQNFLLSDKSSRFLINLARKEDIHVQGYKDGVLYFEKRRPESDHYENHVQLKGVVTDFDTMNPCGFTKMMYVGTHEILEKMKQTALQAIGDETTVIFSSDEFLEFMNRAVSKGSALRSVLSRLNIPVEKTAAFGDGDNDISMLETAGIGVAMENAADTVKKAADFIAPSNNEDGIARFLSPLCL